MTIIFTRVNIYQVWSIRATYPCTFLLHFYHLILTCLIFSIVCKEKLSSQVPRNTSLDCWLDFVSYFVMLQRVELIFFIDFLTKKKLCWHLRKHHIIQGFADLVSLTLCYQYRQACYAWCACDKFAWVRLWAQGYMQCFPRFWWYRGLFFFLSIPSTNF